MCIYAKVLGVLEIEGSGMIRKIKIGFFFWFVLESLIWRVMCGEKRKVIGNMN